MKNWLISPLNQRIMHWIMIRLLESCLITEILAACGEKPRYHQLVQVLPWTNSPSNMNQYGILSKRIGHSMQTVCTCKFLFVGQCAEPLVHSAVVSPLVYHHKAILKWHTRCGGYTQVCACWTLYRIVRILRLVPDRQWLRIIGSMFVWSGLQKQNRFQAICCSTANTGFKSTQGLWKAWHGTYLLNSGRNWNSIGLGEAERMVIHIFTVWRSTSAVKLHWQAMLMKALKLKAILTFVAPIRHVKTTALPFKSIPMDRDDPSTQKATNHASHCLDGNGQSFEAIDTSRIGDINIKLNRAPWICGTIKLIPAWALLSN